MNIFAENSIRPVGIDLTSGAASIVGFQGAYTTFLLAFYPGGNALFSFEILPDASLVQRDIFDVEGIPLAGVSRALEKVGEQSFLISGFNNPEALVVQVDSGGQIFASTNKLSQNDILDDQQFVAEVDQLGTPYAFTVENLGQSIHAIEFGADDTIVGTSVFEVANDPNNVNPNRISDLLAVERDGQISLVASLSGTSSLISLGLNADGSLSQVDEEGLLTGVGISGPHTVISVEFDETTFVVVGATSSSSVSVFELGADGHMTAVTHVTDTRDTRFDHLSAMAHLSVSGAELFFVAGRDGGISALRLTSSGVLVHLDTIVSTADVLLPSITSISAITKDENVLIFLGSEDNDELTTLSMSFDELGLELNTTADSVVLIGSNGDDILVASVMEAELTGGGGADHFVFDAGYGSEGTLGQISDFEQGVDRIFFPNQHLLADVSQFDIQSTTDGAILTYDAISVIVRDINGESLSQDDFDNDTFFEIDTHFVGSFFDITGEPEPEPDGQVLSGSSGADSVSGGDGADLIELGEGNDIANGAAGNDTIYGGNGADRLIGGEGDDRIYGGTDQNDLRDEIFAGPGHDFIDAGYGNDLVYGDQGNDTLVGGFGVDTLVGQAGDDVISGGPLSDLVFGNDGADFLNGGFGFDRLNGGGGADKFFHLGIVDHGSDWIQDYSASDGDVLVFGNPNVGREDFQVNYVETERAGKDGVEEGFVIYRPTGQIIWALVDAEDQDAITLQIGSDTYDIA